MQQTWYSRAFGSIITYCLVIPIWLSILCTVVRVRGRRTVVPWLRRGNVILAVNHPTLLETVAVPALFWHWRIGRRNQVPHSIADEYFFGGRATLQTAAQCILVSRQQTLLAKRKNILALQHTKNLLHRSGVVIYFPEGGRTCKGTPTHICGTRYMRQCHARFIEKVKNNQTVLIPVWVDAGQTDKPVGLGAGYRQLLRGVRMSITFGQPIKIAEISVTDEWLARCILKTGTTAPNSDSA